MNKKNADPYPLIGTNLHFRYLSIYVTAMKAKP